MELDQNTIALICLLERLIGGKCESPRSYMAYRYPVSFTLSHGEYQGHTFRATESWELVQEQKDGLIGKAEIQDLHYKFGANKLYIGQGLQDVLDILEYRYHLDFSKLEEEYLKEHSK